MHLYSVIFGNFFIKFPEFSSWQNNLFEYFWDLFAILGTFQTCENFFSIF